MENSNSFPILLAAFFCEFHAQLGPKVVYEVPEGFTTPPIEPYLSFDSVSEYLIPKPELCNRLVSITTPHYKVVGHPVSIENHMYDRNALIFNLCFVFEKDAETECYEQIVRKVARTFRGLEVDNEANTINLKLFPTYSDPPPVQIYQVPILILNISSIMDKNWDLTMRRVIPHTNGVNTVKKISEIADVRLDLVRICIQHLIYYGCVKLVDIFQFSNVYAPKTHVNSLLTSIEAQRRCIDFVTSQGQPPASFATIFSLYCALKHELTIREFIYEFQVWNQGIDVRRLIIYGILNGFIYRVHKFPVILLNTCPVSPSLHPVGSFSSSKAGSVGGKGGREGTSAPNDIVLPTGGLLLVSGQQVLRRYLDGKHHYDEICTVFDCSPKELDETLLEIQNVEFINK